ncbi:MAG: DUF2851 family protein [Bacteroidota bacterium]|nr:DUF2851 family protein [Bacteroidota bacterium]
MSEDFLHHLWKFKLFNQLDLVTTNNEPVEIIKAGDHNFDSGPDFFNARVKIGETLWAGNVEVHISGSDWNRHQHQHDKAYDNIILHVVYHADKPMHRTSGEVIPTIEIRSRVDQKMYQNYLNFKSSSGWIPCEKNISAVPDLIIQNTIDRLLLDRLERKAVAIQNSLQLNSNNWEETFYQALARNFGFKTNAEPFELLAKSLPSLTVARQRTSLLQIEAMLFGQAGFLNEHFEDEYPRQLQNEYVFLKQKYRLQPIENHLWKFLRLRPVNFPTIRLAQFAGLAFKSERLFSKIMDAETSNELKDLLKVDVSAYWLTHYQFDKPSTKKSKHLGMEAIQNLIINTIVPFLFVWGKQKGEEFYIDRALQFLQELDGEKNTLIKRWEELGLPVAKAYSTQALLQLKTELCNNKKCLSCPAGNYLLKNS